MEVCNFCKEELCDEYLITAPDGKEMRICEDCMADITTFFKTNKAEHLKLQEEDADRRPRLFLISTRSHNGPDGYRLAEKTRFATRIFDNVEIKDIARTQMVDPRFSEAHKKYQDYGLNFRDYTLFGDRVPTITATEITANLIG
jgi:hypothetical protein